MTREATSWPSWSTPNGCARLGPKRAAELVGQVGVLHRGSGQAQQRHDQRGRERDYDEQNDKGKRGQRDAVLAKAPPEQLQRRARGDPPPSVQEVRNPPRAPGSSSAAPMFISWIFPAKDVGCSQRKALDVQVRHLLLGDLPEDLKTHYPPPTQRAILNGTWTRCSRPDAGSERRGARRRPGRRRSPAGGAHAPGHAR